VGRPGSLMDVLANPGATPGTSTDKIPKGGPKMTKAQLLEQSTFMEILLAFLEPSKIDEVSWHAAAFDTKYKYLSPAVRNGVLMRAISVTQDTGNSFSLPYLEKILGTFNDYRINSASEVIKFLENKHNHGKKKKRIAPVPEYMQECKDLLASGN